MRAVWDPEQNAWVQECVSVADDCKGGGGGGGGSDASASNQSTQITLATTTNSLITTGNGLLTDGNTQASNTNTYLTTNVGEASSSAAASDTGTFSIIQFIKRGLQNWTTLLARIPTLVSGRMPVDGSGVTQPVSGTFWQATQPVSGTVAVTGTFWQATQPVSEADGQNIALGQRSQTAATSDTGTFSVISLIKRGLEGTTTALTNWTTLLARVPALVTGRVPVDASGTFVSVVGQIFRSSANFNRPADLNAYALGDLVANSTTAGSVTVMQLTAARVNGGSFAIRKVQLRKSSTPTSALAIFRVHFFTVAPTVANGDNGTYSPNQAASYLGSFDVTIDQNFSDGSCGNGIPLYGAEVSGVCAGGSVLVYALIEARAAYVPASAETITLTAEIYPN